MKPINGITLKLRTELKLKRWDAQSLPIIYVYTAIRDILAETDFGGRIWFLHGVR